MADENKNEAVVSETPEANPAEAKKDTSIDLDGLVRKAKPAQAQAGETTPTAPSQNEETNSAEADASAAEVKRVLSPLEQMKADEAAGKGQQLGAVVETKDLGGPRLKAMDERFDEHMDARIKESEDLIEKRKHVVLLKVTRTQEDLIAAVDELDCLFHNDVTDEWYFDIPDGNGGQKTPEYFRIRTEDDGEYDLNAEAANVGIEPAKQTPTPDKKAPAEAEPTEEEKEKQALVQVIIDKTKSDGKVDFTPEEREKLREANEIHLKKVEMVHVPSALTKRDITRPSFREAIRKQTIGRDSFRVYFPASGFSADMKPLSYGEMNDISIDTETVTTEQYIKRLTVIYNHMENISIGSFDDFDDFLRRFAWTDIAIAVYGLYCATYPEVQQIQMTCGQCNANFNTTFSTRSIYKLDRCTKTYLEALKELMESSPADYDKVHEGSAVMTIRSMKMPNSGIVFNIGIASAYDYVYNFIPLQNQEEFQRLFPDDINATQAETTMLLLSVRSVSLVNPEAEDGFDTYTEYKDILDGIYAIDPDEIRILAAILDELVTRYTPIFSLTNVVCTECNHVTDVVDLDINSLVFLTTLTLKNTGIDVSTMLD